jgi:hypothetical protein
MYFKGDGVINVGAKVFDTSAWRDSIAIDGKGGVGGEISCLILTSMWETVEEVRFRGKGGEAMVLAS